MKKVKAVVALAGIFVLCNLLSGCSSSNPEAEKGTPKDNSKAMEMMKKQSDMNRK